MSKQKREYNVTVISRSEITTYPKMNEPAYTIFVTYVGVGLAPNTIEIPKEKYSKEAEKNLIRKDIERRLKDKPETYRV